MKKTRTTKTNGKKPPRLRRVIDLLIVVAVLLAGAGIVVTAQDGARLLTNAGVSLNLAAPATSAPPRGTFEPPEETNDLELLNQPTIPARPTSRLTPTPSKLDRTMNVLLLGSDKRPEETVWRTDVMMVVFLDIGNGRAAVLSLPRDLYVDIPTRGWDRLNIADFWGEYTKYPGGGAGLLSRVIGENFGIRVDHFARVDFDGFKQIIDTVGGVDVNVPCDLEDDFIDPSSPSGFRHFEVTAGVTHMNGDTALMFVRQRHGNGDVSRAQRQQRVISALRSKVLSTDIITKLPQLYSQLQNAVQTDFSPFDLPQLAQAGATINPRNIRGRVVDETMSYLWMTPDGKSVLIFDKDKVRSAVNDMFDAPTIEESKVLCE